MKLDLLLREYIYRKSFRLENELIEMRNRLRKDDIDNIDLVEYIEQNSRISTANEIFRELYNILEISRSPPKEVNW